MTLLALANGVSDIYTSYIAVNTSDIGINIMFGALLGSGIFATTFIVARILIITKGIQVNKSEVGLSIFFLLSILCIVFVFGLYGCFNLISAILFSTTYLI